MDKKLFLQAIGKFFLGLALVALLLFAPAGTLRFFNAWLLIAILFAPMLCAGLVMLVRAPELLRKRLDAKEEEPAQQMVVLLSAMMFLVVFFVAGVSFRFGWLLLPRWVSWAAAALFLGAYALYAEVLRENAYLSRTIRVQENQRVVDTGLYGVVRHPMYAATLLLFLSMGLVLGSILSFAILLLYIPIIALRIRSEEQVLEAGLEGYAEYRERVRYKVIPYLW